MKRRLTRTVLMATTALLVACLLPAAGAATVKIYDTDGNKLLGEIDSAKCKIGKGDGKGGKDFSAVGRTKDRSYTLDVQILRSWRGFGEDYSLFFGLEDPAFFLHGPDDLYSNAYPVPGTPPGTVGGGAIHFSGNGKQLRIGFAPAANEAFTKSVVFAGGMKCKYPRKR